MKSASWKAFATLASIGAAIAARKAATSLWQRQVGDDPPVNPADPKTDWTEALGWTVATGVLVGVARLFARRGAAALWEKVEGSLPPELEDAV
ncbi:MAG TPA: DUF4235 domain-containing protein [Egicoccus sp.]|nr:DUF4235 domain-containing protein [Egicoccus sp.]HSK24494.1 DUF4235 domain-containing protein [Egicoccus sp.]